MPRFLKLTKSIINKNAIHHIEINKDNFVVHFMTNKTNGLFVFGVGLYDSYNTEFKVCKIKNPSDYKTISDWVNNKFK